MNAFILFRVIVHFSDKNMDVRIPFEITSKGVNGSDSPEVSHLSRIEVVENIKSVFNWFTRLGSFPTLTAEKITIKDNGNSISGSDKKKAQGRAVFTKKFTIRLRNSKNNMTWGTSTAIAVAFSAKIF